MDSYMVSCLPQADRDLMANYIAEFGGGGGRRPQDFTQVLRAWSANKFDLYKAFGERHIIKKEVDIAKSLKQMDEEMWDVMRYSPSPAVARFRQAYMDAIDALDIDFGTRYSLRSLVIETEFLTENVYDGKSVVIPERCTVSGKPMQVNSGCKPVKAIGKICKAIGLEVKVHYCRDCNTIVAEDHTCPFCGGEASEVDCFEEFRRVHSMVLNQKRLRGNLCISIHPMDYFTMSDNDSGWSSCMTWTGKDENGGEPGDYRAGTVEMMNSPNVIVAYLESSTPMKICGTTWNNKRWRQLIIVNDAFIVGNRQYPYTNDELEAAALSMVREQLNGADHFGKYEEELRESSSYGRIDMGDKQIQFEFSADMMYNDLHRHYRGFFDAEKCSQSTYHHLNYSGEATCVVCGDSFHYGENSVVCPACADKSYCDYCEQYFDDEPYHDAEGNTYCEYCWDRWIVRCPQCGEFYHEGRIETIKLVLDGSLEHPLDMNKVYYKSLYMCPECYAEEDLSKFGEVRRFGGINFVHISNVSDEGLRQFAADHIDYELLIKIKYTRSEALRKLYLKDLN